ncbi:MULTISPECIES: hypothetical protein [unclassified Streptomyces]|uniref:hypothetical protein n=1 Tax=unclassified Streptomyces TaxID=2593676 RepID=UPI002E171EC3|nr:MULTISPECIES: hypothetical protein [unclassified Streptomyces]
MTGPRRGRQGSEFVFTGPRHHERVRRAIADRVCRRVPAWRTYFSEAALFDLVDDVIQEAVLARTLDDRNPVAYLTQKACWLAQRDLTQVGRNIDLVEAGEVDFDTCQPPRTVDGIQYAPYGHPPGCDSDTDEAEAAVQRAVDAMQPSQRRRMAELALANVDIPHAAATLGIPRNQADQALHQVVRKLRQDPEIQNRTRTKYTREYAGSPAAQSAQPPYNSRSNE